MLLHYNIIWTVPILAFSVGHVSVPPRQTSSDLSFGHVIPYFCGDVSVTCSGRAVWFAHAWMRQRRRSPSSPSYRSPYILP